MRFALVDQAKKDFPVHRLCRVLGISQSGYFAWKDRPASRRQQGDMAMLAHVRSAFAPSNGTYDSPRMTRELKDDGFAIGRRRTARLMRENSLRARQKRRFKALLSLSKGGPPTASTLVRSRQTSPTRISRQRPRTRNGASTSPMSGPAKAGCTSPSSSTCSPGASSVGPSATGPRSGRDAAGEDRRRLWPLRRGRAGVGRGTPRPCG